jgi:hypothetical protein
MNGTDSTVEDAIFLGCVAHDVVIAANDYGRAIADAQTLEQLATIKEALDESIGALLAQEQIAVRKREILEIQERSRR